MNRQSHIAHPLTGRLKGIGLGYGILVGLLLAAPLIGLMYLLDTFAGFPFVPFTLFDWLARVLPGPLVTFGIDLMVYGMCLVGMSVADAAKTAEQIGAVLLLFSIVAVAGAIYFAIIKGRGLQPQHLSGLVLGAAVGSPLAIVTVAIGHTFWPPFLVLLGVLLLFALWGMAYSQACRHLAIGALGTQDSEVTDEAVTTIGRRQFLIRLGATTATITVLSGSLGALMSQLERIKLDRAVASSIFTRDTPGLASDRIFHNSDDPLIPAVGTRLEYTSVEDHYKVYLLTEPTVIDIAAWSLPITGLVHNPRTLTIENIRENFDSRDQYVTLSCISGRIATTLISTTHWTGVSMQQILASVQPQDDARHLVITCADGFHETVDIDLIASDERIMLAYAWDGYPIPMDHGAPLRIWLPDRYGMKQPKWITGIEVVADYQEGYWVKRGWDEVAQVRATSVIDTISVDHVYQEGDQTLIPVGGIAFSGARGISKVEIRVDGGPWQRAQLRAPLSETTWVIWRYDWPFESGDHTFEVRCVDGDGTPQIEERMGNRPSGATGTHERQAQM